jgi:hypothetical protein
MAELKASECGPECIAVEPEHLGVGDPVNRCVVPASPGPQGNDLVRVVVELPQVRVEVPTKVSRWRTPVLQQVLPMIQTDGKLKWSKLSRVEDPRQGRCTDSGSDERVRQEAKIRLGRNFLPPVRDPLDPSLSARSSCGVGFRWQARSDMFQRSLLQGSQRLARFKARQSIARQRPRPLSRNVEDLQEASPAQSINSAFGLVAGQAGAFGNSVNSPVGDRVGLFPSPPSGRGRPQPVQDRSLRLA